VEGKEVTSEQMISASDTSLPLVTVPAPSSKENGVMWATSPDRLELPPRPYNHNSNCSDSPCVSETSSDIFSKREVIQKLRQQLKRRDDMIQEMQEQILELQNSYNAQTAHSSHLQAQLDTLNRDLFESEREVQRLRKAIADHSVGCGADSNGKTSPVGPWNGGFMDSESNYESQEKSLRDGERVEMLRKEVSELKEVIDGKEYLLRSYKEQKIELSQKVKELQQRLDSQLQNLL
jgi:DNA repair exonuclease SbcCD ATPase subunit